MGQYLNAASLSLGDTHLSEIISNKICGSMFITYSLHKIHKFIKSHEGNMYGEEDD